MNLGTGVALRPKISLATDGLVTKHVAMIQPSPNMAKGFTTVGHLGTPDFDLAAQQHAAYVCALRAEGVKVDVYPATKNPDQHFIEDIASVFRSSSGEPVAVVARPATLERSLEVAYVAEGILPAYLPKSNIAYLPSYPDITIEFGDVVRFGGNVLVGISKRTTIQGAIALADTLARINPNYKVSQIAVDGGLHADTCLSPINATTLLHDPSNTIPAGFPFQTITLPEPENYAASVLVVNSKSVIMPRGYPFTAGVLAQHFKTVIEVPMGQFGRMDGSLRCLKMAVHWDSLPWSPAE